MDWSSTGSIPRGPMWLSLTPQPVTLPATRHVTRGTGRHLPLLYISYPTVSLGPQEPALHVADVLRRLCQLHALPVAGENQQAIDVGASHYCEELACTRRSTPTQSGGRDGSLKTPRRWTR